MLYYSGIGVESCECALEISFVRRFNIIILFVFNTGGYKASQIKIRIAQCIIPTEVGIPTLKFTFLINVFSPHWPLCLCLYLGQNSDQCSTKMLQFLFNCKH